MTNETVISHQAEPAGLAERGENEGRRRHVLGPQLADQRQAVELRQHAVDDQHIVVAVERHAEAVLAVAGAIGDVPGLAEGFDQIVGRVAVVFDNEQAHCM